MFKKYKKPLVFLLILAILGQVLFVIVSNNYTTPYYENRIFATIGIQFDGSDLHKLNEGAHYFGQTMIGWTKFPNFRNDLMEDVELPDDLEVNMHLQERQNIIFSLITNDPIELDQLISAKTFLQDKLDNYNFKTKTKFVLANVDYDQIEVRRPYWFGALTALILSIVIGFAVLFVCKEFFPPKLKL